jgi:glycosyltransferase involved in cell wall biosynthesis
MTSDSQESAPMVSVCMITYNHEKYIAQAIESVISQKTNFCFELVIGEDYSKDNTLSICKKYQTRYPKIIRILDRGKNLGMMPNSIDTLTQCRGEFIAVCEGDDYWTNDQKLQKQYDHIIKNDLALSFHEGYLMAGNEIQPYKPYPKPINTETNEYGVQDILQSGPLTSSMMFRKSMIFPLPDYLSEAISGDHTLQILLALRGKIGFINEIMSVYRQHPQGITSVMNPKKWLLNRISIARRIMNDSQQVNNRHILRHIHDLYISVALNHRVSKIDGLKFLCQAIFNYPMAIITEPKKHLYYSKLILLDEAKHN